MNQNQQLPVEAILPELIEVLAASDSVVLQAPPGAGKTTLVPLALLHSAAIGDGKILVLEPRRLAARAAAERMAQNIGEQVGDTVGYRIRSDSKISAATRIEVVTEGVLNRMLLTDPSLDGVSIVIFDEFHERSVDADLGLALCLAGRELFRDADDPLKIVVMSATLDTEGVSALLGNATVVASSGKAWPVDIRYGKSPQAHQRIEPMVVRTVLTALNEEQGSILVFLPGQREIREVARQLREHFANEAQDSPEVFTLFGDMKLADQRQAIRPAPDGARKIVVASAIAETSLTIEGVRVVIDSGLSRLPRFDPRTGMSRLTTQRVSQASATQRTGRAGRLESGVAYRLWSQDEQRSMVAQTPAEILQADLAPILLSLLKFGVADVNELSWIDVPPAAALSQAEDLLLQLGAIVRTEDSLLLTQHGEKMSELPMHPRLSHMLVVAASMGLSVEASRLAAILSSRDPLRDGGIDLASRLSLFESAGQGKSRRGVGGAMSELRTLASQYESASAPFKKESSHSRLRPDQVPGYLTALAYPDRIARQRENGVGWQLANGRSAQIREGDPLSNRQWLSVAHVGGTRDAASDQIYLACEFDPVLLEQSLKEMVEEHEVVGWELKDRAMSAHRQSRLGSLVIDSVEIDDLPAQRRRDAVIGFVRKQGLSALPFDEDAQSLRRRVAYLKGLEENEGGDSKWPDLSDQALMSSLDDWLSPYINNVSHVNHFAKLNISDILKSMLQWPLSRELDELAPMRFAVPSGSMIKIDYEQSPPVLAVKLQEMFGCVSQPTIAHGVPLKVALLSPAGRPVQVTADIAGFWTGSYSEVQKDMKGRYPRHYWPDDPQKAQPSSRTTKRPGK